MSSGNLLWGEKKKKKTPTKIQPPKPHNNPPPLPQTKQPTQQQTPQSSGPMALEQDSVHSFLFLSASDADLYRHFIFDFVINAKRSF